MEIMKTKPRSRQLGRKKAPARGLPAKLVRIGNSRGVRLPKSVIDQVGLKDKVEISVSNNQVIITPAGADRPRAGWAESIKAAVAEHGNELTEEDRDWLDAPLNSEWEEKEWTW
jgi:antitoxin MazE